MTGLIAAAAAAAAPLNRFRRVLSDAGRQA